VDSIDALFDLFEGKISLQSHAKLIRLDIRRILEPAMKALHEEDEDQEEEELERQLIMASFLKCDCKISHCTFTDKRQLLWDIC
jgi:hypothetical protein